MKQLLFTLVLLMSISITASAQWFRKPTPNDTLQSVRVLDNGNVVYSIYAPKAHIVSLAGDAMPWGQKIEAKEHDNGVWTIEVPNVKPGVYRYHFVVDGLPVYDP